MGEEENVRLKLLTAAAAADGTIPTTRFLVLLSTAYNNDTFWYRYSVVLYKYNIIILCCTGKRNDRYYIPIFERMQNIL